MSEISAEKLVSVYIKLRNARQELKAKYDNEDAALEKQLNMVSERLQDMMKSIEADSLKTKFGTVSRKIKVRYWPSDLSLIHISELCTTLSVSMGCRIFWSNASARARCRRFWRSIRTCCPWVLTRTVSTPLLFTSRGPND